VSAGIGSGVVGAGVGGAGAGVVCIVGAGVGAGVGGAGAGVVCIVGAGVGAVSAKLSSCSDAWASPVPANASFKGRILAGESGSWGWSWLVAGSDGPVSISPTGGAALACLLFFRSGLFTSLAGV
jgi:hypothetical protein